MASFSACGGGGQAEQPAPEAPLSKLAKRVFLLNQFSGKIQIIDAATDTLSGFVIPSDFSSFSNAQFLLRAGTRTLVFDAGSNGLYAIDSTTETVKVAVGLSGATESVVVSADGNTAYAAIPTLGRIDLIDLLNNKLLDPINGLPGVRRLVISKNGAKILAFSNDVNTFSVVTTSDKTVTAAIGTFDRPYTGVFSSDDTKAFILNCGAECGGAAAAVTVLDMTTNAGGSSVGVGGATVGYLEGSNLYVAGSPAVSTATFNGGTLNVVNVANPATLTTSGAAAISDGLHHTIVPVGSGKFYIGATRCTIINTGTVSKGCLSILNGTTTTVGAARGEVTSITPIKNRTVVYVTQGGDLDIYSSATDTLQAKQIDIVGKAVDAKEID
ncbi:MAG TPA: hypothetical protein VMZ25_11900 [Terriglobales bacterium]|nr:hypothetical protein [Terriglobales bacterium]